MNQPWKVILVLVGIFIFGAVSGSFVTLRISRNKVLNRPVPEEWAPRHLKQLAERLDLTPEQQEQIRPIVHHNMELLGRVRSNSMKETQTVVEAMRREITEKLTTEQRTKFEQMNRELREAHEARERIEREKRKNLERITGEKQPGDKPSGDKSPLPKPAGN